MNIIKICYATMKTRSISKNVDCITKAKSIVFTLVLITLVSVFYCTNTNASYENEMSLVEQIKLLEKKTS